MQDSMDDFALGLNHINKNLYVAHINA
jgi:hypothetical protein